MRAIFRAAMLARCIALASLFWIVPAHAQTKSFDVPAQPATQAIPEFARQASIQIVAPGIRLRGIQTNAIRGQFDVREALKQMLVGTGLAFRDENGTILVVKDPSPSPN
ncbi:MAG: TonB-dependent receptor-like protein [Rhodospirillales bacterium]|jgi:iron complex outermembrane receptor protein|nr:TonB-dependent receptor-like protein [Rhodospirillales bacterium]